MNTENKRVEFIWNLHFKCNYRCSYCSFDGRWTTHSKENLYLSADEWAACWDSIYRKYGSVNITLIGGEPCIYPSFFKLAEQLTKKHYISLTTNLSRDFKVFAERIDPCRMNGGIGASFHPAFAEFNSFLARVLFLKKKGFVVWVCYVAYPPQLKQMAHYKKRFKQNGLNFIVQPFRGFYKNVPYPESYTERDKEYIRQITEEDERVLMDMEYQLDRKSTKGRLCAAGQMLAHILPDASAWRCSEHQESNFCLGSILDENFRLLDAPLACKSETCPCDYLYLLD